MSDIYGLFLLTTLKPVPLSRASRVLLGHFFIGSVFGGIVKA